MRKLFLAVGLFIAGLAGSVQAQFCPGVSPWVFDDVLASDPFCPNITWMALNSITLGCKTIDALNRDYCPNDSVTRKQMAAFMFRLGTIRVEEVDTGPGLTGGPITLAGTIGLATTQLLPTTACTSGQVPKWSGSNWTCATVAGGGGTVTSVVGGTGVVASPSPITTSGTLNLALSYQLPQGCSNGQVAKSNGSGGWTCATAGGTGTVTSVGTGTGLTGGPITASGTIAIANAGVGNAQLANGAVDVSKLNVASTDTRYFKQGGNALGTTAIIGTADGQVLDLYSNGRRVLRLDGVNSADANLIGGASSNSASTSFLAQTIAGGSNNATGASYATVGGGGQNVANSSAATVGGGGNNMASGPAATVVGGGFNIASGGNATVGGGYANTASGQYSFAAGYYANADGAGCFVFADSSSAIKTKCNSPNVFVARAVQGFYLYTAGNENAGYTGVYLGAGSSSWSTLSDRNSKANIEPVDAEAVLAKLAAIPIATWNWKAQNTGVRHMGPMAQDFRTAFGLGEDDKHITTVDEEGVALAAIQGLNAKLEERVAEQQREIADLRESLRGELAALRSALAELQHPQASVAAK
jgi:endosialidase-like protein